MVRPPLPLAGEEVDEAQPHPATAPDDPPAERVVKVPGVRCSRQHFNNPSALYCRVCGISMLQQTHVQVTDVRPPLGVVVVDDGATFSLDADYAVGARPDTDGRVGSGQARPLQLGSANGSLEPVHVLLTADGWDVVVENVARQAPVAVWHRGMPQWEQLAPGSRAVLKPGSHVALGDRRLVFESNTRA